MAVASASAAPAAAGLVGLLDAGGSGLVVERKVALLGRPGVGKTTLALRLARYGNLPQTHTETTGVSVTHVPFPGTLGDGRACTVRYSFCDAGASSLEKYDYLRGSVLNKCDAYLFLFSVTDRASFDDLEGRIGAAMQWGKPRAAAIVATKNDSIGKNVTEEELAGLARRFDMPVFGVQLPARPVTDPREPLPEAPAPAPAASAPARSRTRTQDLEYIVDFLNGATLK